VTVIAEGEIFSDDNVKVTAFRVPHGTCCPVSYGFTFVSADRTIVISGDTAKSEEVAKQVRRADVLIHEVYSAKKYESASDTSRQYLRLFHTSATELAEIANKAKPGLLILTHQLGTDECDIRGLADEVRKAGYWGKISNGNDLDVFWVPTEDRARRASASSRRAE
jgi:ribonuclease BN (tRNA processing enzyme)